ncbi:MAG: hypothetical protein WAO94_02170, partial [Dysgonamonadaceae bacterium]
PAQRVHELSRVTQQKTTVCLWDSDSACTRTFILQVAVYAALLFLAGSGVSPRQRKRVSEKYFGYPLYMIYNDAFFI